MWGRKKRAETGAQSSIDTVAPASYWATHAEPAPGAAPQPMTTDPQSSDQPVLPRVDATLTVGSQQVDPASPEGRWLLSVGPEDKARRMLEKRGPLLSDLGLDQGALLKVLAQPGWQKHVAELVPLMMRHACHEITDAQFDAEQRRIIGGG